MKNDIWFPEPPWSVAQPSKVNGPTAINKIHFNTLRIEDSFQVN
jgi:hypothetical protein